MLVLMENELNSAFQVFRILEGSEDTLDECWSKDRIVKVGDTSFPKSEP